jgi:hypothetical protein
MDGTIVPGHTMFNAKRMDNFYPIAGQSLPTQRQIGDF